MSKSEEQKKESYNSDITKHDLDILNQKNIHGDGGDDQQLKDRKQEVDFEGKDLDIPGRTTAKKGHGPKGLNDEENKLHSQGGSGNEHLERDDSAV